MRSLIVVLRFLFGELFLKDDKVLIFIFSPDRKNEKSLIDQAAELLADIFVAQIELNESEKRSNTLKKAEFKEHGKKRIRES